MRKPWLKDTYVFIALASTFLVVVAVGLTLLPKIRASISRKESIKQLLINGVSYNYDWFDECGTIKLSHFAKNKFNPLRKDLIRIAPQLHQVVIADSTLSTEDVAVLAQLHQVYELQILHSELPEVFPELLSEMPNLTMLDLTNTRWGNDRAPALSTCTRLTHLAMSHRELTDDLVKEISTIPNLFQLRVDVSGCVLADIIKLVLRLRTKLNVTTLDIVGELNDADSWQQLLGEIASHGIVAGVQPNGTGIRISRRKGDSHQI
jgi:hypothetical protein